MLYRNLGKLVKWSGLGTKNFPVHGKPPKALSYCYYSGINRDLTANYFIKLFHVIKLSMVGSSKTSRNKDCWHVRKVIRR